MNCRSISIRTLFTGLAAPLFLSGTVHAGEILVASGTLDNFQQDYYGAPENRSTTASEGNFTLVVDYDPQALASAAGNNSEQWRDAVLSMDLTVYGKDGAELLSHRIEPDIGNYPEASVLNVQHGGNDDVLSWEGRQYGGAEWLELTLYGQGSELRAADWQYPDQPPASFLGSLSFGATIQGASSTETISIDGTVTGTEAGQTTADADGDGVEDAADSCSSSFISQTVVIGDLNTGVANEVDAVGCTISDRVASCAAIAVNEMQFKGCVSKVSGDLQHDGVINGRERGLLQRAAAAQ